MKHFNIFLFMVGISTSIIAQPAFNWSKSSDTAYSTDYSRMISNPQGDVYISGNNRSIHDIEIIKYDKNGNKMWEQTDTNYLNSPSIIDLCLGDNRNIYSTGYVRIPSVGESSFLSKYDNDGNLLWEKYYNGVSDTFVRISSMIYFNSFVYLAGSASDLQNKSRVLIQKYDTTGQLIWAITDTMNNSGEDEAFYITHDSQNIILTGYSNKLNVIQEKMFIAKYDINGNKIWQKLDNFTSDENMGYNVAVDRNNDIYVLTPSSQYRISKYDTNGNFQWGYSPVGLVYPSSYGFIKFDNSNNIYLAGVAGISGGFDYVNAFLFDKLKADGTPVFHIVGQREGYASGFDFLSQNDIIITGILDTLGNRMIDFDSLGNIKWSHFYQNDVPNSYCYSVVIDSMKNILLGGEFNLFISVSKPALQVIKYGNNNSGINFIPKEIGLVNIYPIPFSDNVTIETQQKSDIEISNIQGQIIKTMYCSNTLTSVDLTDLSSGVYIVKIKTENEIVTKKIIKK